MNIDKNNLTPEMIQQAMKCKSADELLALEKEAGCDMTREEAEAYLAEFSDFELNLDTLEKVSGGTKSCYMVDGCAFKCGTLKDC